VDLAQWDIFYNRVTDNGSKITTEIHYVCTLQFASDYETGLLFRSFLIASNFLARSRRNRRISVFFLAMCSELAYQLDYYTKLQKYSAVDGYGTGKQTQGIRIGTVRQLGQMQKLGPQFGLCLTRS